jgi:homeobox-leucine zipper protein
VEEIMRIITSPNPKNYISLLHIDGTNSGTAKRLILQESCMNSIESYLVYTKINFFEMRVVLNGIDPNSVALLPSGFAIIPNEAATKGVGVCHGTNIDGTLLTIAIQKVVHLG